MDNTKVQEFMNSLTEEQRTAMLACKTEEELDNVIDEYDIDLPDEMLEEVAGGRGRLLSSLLAGVIVFTSSAGALSTITASAAESTETATTAGEFGKALGINEGNYAFEQLKNEFPEAAPLLIGYQTLFNESLKDHPEKMIISKLNDIENKLDDISERLNYLNDKVDRNTEWISKKFENSIEMNDLRRYFRELHSLLQVFIPDINAAEANPHKNDTQKIVNLANLKSGENYRDINLICNSIMQYMDSNSVTSSNMYELLYQNRALECMAEKEAYTEALPIAQAFTEEFVYAVLLLTECQRAADAVGNFTEEDVKALGTGKERKLYDELCEGQLRSNMDKDIPSARLVAASEGISEFKKHDRCCLIFKGTKSYCPEYGFTFRTYSQWLANKNDLTLCTSPSNDCVLSFDDITELASYIRGKYKDSTFMEYLEKWCGIPSNTPQNTSGSTFSHNSPYYLFLSNDYSRTDKEDRGHEGLGVMGGALVDCYKKYCKVLNVNAPGCPVEEILAVQYDQYDYYTCGVHVDTEYVNVITPGANIIAIKFADPPYDPLREIYPPHDLPPGIIWA